MRNHYLVARVACSLGLLLTTSTPGHCVAAAFSTGDWPTVHHDVARSASVPDSPAPPFHRKWVWTGAVLENIDTWAEAIVSSNQVFAGTYAGNLYALNRETGQVNWRYTAGNLIVGSPAVEGRTVYVGSLGDLMKPGYVHALDSVTGGLKWKFEAPGGFWTSPCIYKGLVLMGGRDGVFYAFDVLNGSPKWKYKTGGPILTTAAAIGDSVLFASEEGRAYCLNVNDGALRWRSESLMAATMRGYYPMIWGDTALFVTMPALLAYDAKLRDEGEDLLGKRMGGEKEGVRTGRWKKKANPGLPSPLDVEKERQLILDWLAEDPRRQSAWALKLSNGTPRFTVPIIWHAGNMGLQNPGCITPDGWFCTAAASYLNNWRAGEAYCPVRVHLEDGRLDVLNWEQKHPAAPPGFGNTFEYDEAYNFTCGGKRIYFSHQDNLWGLDLDGNVGFKISGERDRFGGIYGGFNSPEYDYRAEKGGRWLEADGVKVYSSANQWHGTGQGTIAICGKELFWITGGMVICLEGDSAPGAKDAAVKTGAGLTETPPQNAPSAKEPTDAAIDALLTEALPASPQSSQFEAVSSALNQHVKEMLDAGDLMPLVCPTGANTVYAYNHPEDTFRSLSLALPYLKPGLRDRAIDFLRKAALQTPPLQPQSLDLTGTPRVTGNVYDIVKQGAQTGPAIKPYQGLYALWAFCFYGNQIGYTGQCWPQIKPAADQACADAEQFLKKAASTPAEKLSALQANELINALLAAYRLGIMTGDSEQISRVRPVLTRLLKQRLALPVRDTRVWCRTEPAMWYALTPELARFLAQTDGDRIRYCTSTPGLLNAFTTEKVDFTRKNFWHLAWGEGCQTDEQAMLYPQYPLALFQLRTFVFNDAPEQLAHLSDIPWCTGDLAWIEKLTLTLWASEGHHWQKTTN